MHYDFQSFWIGSKHLCSLILSLNFSKKLKWMDGKPNAVVCTCRPANKPKGKVLWGCASCVELCMFSRLFSGIGVSYMWFASACGAGWSKQFSANCRGRKLHRPNAALSRGETGWRWHGEKFIIFCQQRWRDSWTQSPHLHSFEVWIRKTPSWKTGKTPSHEGPPNFSGRWSRLM